MLKAASYLNSRDYFSKTRNYILKSSNMVVQDDSGIPYKYFIDGTWDVKLYGGYKKVIPLFSSRIQPDMVRAYADTTKLTSKNVQGLGQGIQRGILGVGMIIGPLVSGPLVYSPIILIALSLCLITFILILVVVSFKRFIPKTTT
jgi:hypothetical protein